MPEGSATHAETQRVLFQIIPTLRPAGAERVVLHLLQYHDRYRLGRVVPVAIAERVRESIQQAFGYPNAPLIPNGIAVDKFSLPAEARWDWRLKEGIPKDALVIVHVGRFTQLKNHEMLIRAFAKLQLPASAYLLLVGEGELRSQTEQLVRELGVADKVRFWGIRADVPDLLNAADIFTLPSKYEGNPMSVMEAMAAGLPVVATAVGGVPELVEDGKLGLLVSASSDSGLAQALQTMIDAPELRSQMGQTALSRAREQFDIQHTVRLYEQTYERLLLARL